MPITNRPAAKPKSAAAAHDFIEQAPDTKPVRWQRGSKTQVTWSVDPELLERVDQVARQRYLSRAALLTTWVLEGLERDTSEAS